MELFRVITSVFDENCFIYSNSSQCVVFDPGSDYDEILSFITDKNLTVEYILLTHCHFDHIGAVYELANKFNAKVFCHKDDQKLIDECNEDRAHYGLPSINVPKIDKYVEDNDIIDFHGVEIKVIHTPGHSEGSVCYYIPLDKLLISGDTIFYEAIGRTDFAYGNPEDIVLSIKNKIYTLPDNVKICPGHGLNSTIGHEKEFNPFIVA